MRMLSRVLLSLFLFLLVACLDFVELSRSGLADNNGNVGAKISLSVRGAQGGKAVPISTEKTSPTMLYVDDPEGRLLAGIEIHGALGTSSLTMETAGAASKTIANQFGFNIASTLRDNESERLYVFAIKNQPTEFYLKFTSEPDVLINDRKVVGGKAIIFADQKFKFNLAGAPELNLVEWKLKEGPSSVAMFHQFFEVGGPVFSLDQYQDKLNEVVNATHDLIYSVDTAATDVLGQQLYGSRSYRLLAIRKDAPFVVTMLGEDITVPSANSGSVPELSSFLGETISIAVQEEGGGTIGVGEFIDLGENLVVKIVQDGTETALLKNTADIVWALPAGLLYQAGDIKLEPLQFSLQRPDNEPILSKKISMSFAKTAVVVRSDRDYLSPSYFARPRVGGPFDGSASLVETTLVDHEGTVEKPLNSDDYYIVPSPKSEGAVKIGLEWDSRSFTVADASFRLEAQASADGGDWQPIADIEFEQTTREGKPILWLEFNPGEERFKTGARYRVWPHIIRKNPDEDYRRPLAFYFRLFPQLYQGIWQYPVDGDTVLPAIRVKSGISADQTTERGGRVFYQPASGCELVFTLASDPDGIDGEAHLRKVSWATKIVPYQSLPVFTYEGADTPPTVDFVLSRERTIKLVALDARSYGFLTVTATMADGDFTSSSFPLYLKANGC